MKFKKNQIQPLQELEMPDFRQQMGPNPYPQMGQMGQMYQQHGQQPFTQTGGQQSYQQPGPQLF
ncbi:spore coat protein GerQ, partial [Escherichia coli]|nr:spore coat protein GerQ [Escherichia coli]